MVIFENIDIDKAILKNIDIDIDIDKVILENIDIDIDMVILENIDIDIDKAILQNIDIDKISNRFKFGISNRASVVAAFSYLLTRKERRLGRLLLTERSLNTLQIGKNK